MQDALVVEEEEGTPIGYSGIWEAIQEPSEREDGTGVFLGLV